MMFSEMWANVNRAAKDRNAPHKHKPGEGQAGDESWPVAVGVYYDATPSGEAAGLPSRLRRRCR